MRRFSPFALVLFAVHQCSAQSCTPGSLPVANSDFDTDISSWTPSGNGAVTWITSPMLVSGASAGQAQLSIPAIPHAFTGVAQLGIGSFPVGTPISVSGWVRFDPNTTDEAFATCEIAISDDVDYKLFTPTAKGWQQYTFTGVSDRKAEAANLGVTCNGTNVVTAYIDLIQFTTCPDGTMAPASTASGSPPPPTGGLTTSMSPVPTASPTFYGNGTTALPTTGQIVSTVITYLYIDVCTCKEGTKQYTTTTTLVYAHCGCTDMKPPTVPCTTTTAVYELSGAPKTATLTLPIKGAGVQTNGGGGGGAAANTGGGAGGGAGGAGGPTRWSSPTGSAGSSGTTAPMQVVKGSSMKVSAGGIWAGVGVILSSLLLL